MNDELGVSYTKEYRRVTYGKEQTTHEKSDLQKCKVNITLSSTCKIIKVSRLYWTGRDHLDQYPIIIKKKDHSERRNMREIGIKKILTSFKIVSASCSILNILPTAGTKPLCHSQLCILSNLMPSSIKTAEIFAASKHFRAIEGRPHDCL